MTLFITHSPFKEFTKVTRLHILQFQLFCYSGKIFILQNNIYLIMYHKHIILYIQIVVVIVAIMAPDVRRKHHNGFVFVQDWLQSGPV